MNRSIKYQFMLVLISICIFSPVLIAKSSEDGIKLKFETDNKKSQLWLTGRPKNPGQGPIKPTHVAIFHIRRPHVDMPSSHPGILQILNTSAGKSLSQQQQKFLSASDAITWWGIEEIKNHDTVLIYAVSEEDAKKTVQAYFEIPANEANARIQEYEKYLKDKQQQIVDIKNILPEKQKKADEIEPKYMDIMNANYLPLSHDEAYEKAKETILEMDKKLDILEIELAGIKEKIQSIENFRRIRSLGGHDFSQETLNKLEQMLVEQLIELKSAEAREQAAIKIRNKDKAFVDLYYQWKNIRGEVYKLKANLENAENQVKEIEEELSNPKPYLLPPEIYQNKVTIYPVRTE